jgi:hypothetical protein
MNRKNGTKIQHKNPPNLNRPKSPKSTEGGFFGPKKPRSGVTFDGPTIVKRTHLGEQNALFYGLFLFGRALFATESNTKNGPINPPQLAPVYI